ncbi:angiopoietin-related protein 1 [Drosophila busckii]|uniref:angiopoietin-related protein 1 n=1 Tax=Drosophila busckii TaxID=30019 RepID=UPI001432C497|nr:angiopoietin-related protein 1 [Drosophila busckii]
MKVIWNINELLAVKRQQLAELRERATQQQNTQNNNCTKCERELAHRVHQLQAQQLKPCELPTTTNVPPSRNASDLLYDNELAGPGWIVIQQRINGLENFNRSWQDYRNGFGSFEGDFFLGLEHIYRLTNAQRHELYIHMERFNGSTYFARYSDFRISRERDEYRLQELGDMTGTAADKLTYHKYQQFSTYDRDTDSGGCAKKYYGGWWYKGHNWHCSFSNLNGKYFQSEKESNLAVYWGQEFSLLTVKMLIRPVGK